jgi:signal transduction histidine kinase
MIGGVERKESVMYARHQAALVELTRSVIDHSDVPLLMRQVAGIVADTLAVPYCAIWELQPDGNAAVLRAGVGWPDVSFNTTTVEISATPLLGAALVGTTPAIVEDWSCETRFASPPALAERGIISSLAVAIDGPAQPFGSLEAGVTAIRKFSDEEIDFLQAIANIVTLAIERARLYQSTDQRADRPGSESAVLEERQRLARDLHDSVTQALYSVTLHAQGVRRLLSVGEVAVATDALRELQETAQEALDELRLLIFELRPPILEQVGLVAAIQGRLNAVEGRANLQTKLLAEGIGLLVPPVEQALYRIVQEALNNTLKHARAGRITVRLNCKESRIVLEIHDDGVGFEPHAVETTGGQGLRGIAERVNQLGGALTLQSAPGAGTLLRVEAHL